MQIQRLHFYLPMPLMWYSLNYPLKLTRSIRDLQKFDLSIKLT